MSTYAELQNKYVRGAILLLAHGRPGYAVNDNLLGSMLEASGYTMSRDAIRTQLAWLAEQGLVNLQAVGAMQVASLTTRGQDVALGRAFVPGVKRPDPGESS